MESIFCKKEYRILKYSSILKCGIYRVKVNGLLNTSPLYQISTTPGLWNILWSKNDAKLHYLLFFPLLL